MRHFFRLFVSLGVAACGASLAQEHPAFSAPSGFAITTAGERERVFERAVPNGDRLRIRVILTPGADDVEAIAKGPAVEDGDQVHAEKRQVVKVGALAGVSYSVLGRSETIEGVAYTRYRRVLGLRIEGQPVLFATRADILAREPHPAQSTLDAMARALTEWQQRLGGVVATPPAESGADPASKPALGGDQLVKLTGGGDLEIQVPAFWGRASLTYAPGQEEILLGPARDVIEKITSETIAKDKDRIGPYVSIARLQKDTFKDLVDVQILDIKESLLADYVARMADAGITLTLSEDRDEGTLGSRTVISVPFEEKRASGTQHRGRSVFMMHKGSLVVVTASHPFEKFDEGWPDVARAFDTLLFTGNDDGGPESQPASRPAEPPPADATPPAIPEPEPEKPRPAPPEWTRQTRDALKTVEIPVATPITIAIPAAWTLLGDADPARAVLGFVATPAPERAADALASSVRISYFTFREDLLLPGAATRLAGLLRLLVDQGARAQGLELGVLSAQDVSIDGRAGFAIQYTLKGEGRSAAGTATGTLIDGSVAIVDFRIAGDDAAALSPLAGEIQGSIRIAVNDVLETRGFGPYGVLVPAGWEVSESENPGGGRNIFMKAPSGVDVRFQTAIQKRASVIDQDVLRRVATGFLVDGLKVFTVTDMARAGRFPVPGGGPGMRVASRTPQMDVVAFAWMQGDHMVFALRGAPAGYAGRDLAIAARILTSFAIAGVDRVVRVDPPRVAGAAMSRRVVFSRTGLDGVGLDGSIRRPSTLTVSLLPDGNVSVAVTRDGRVEDVRGTYRIEGDQVSLDGAGLGRLTYRFSDDGETLTGAAPGDVLFRARQDEAP